MARLTNDEMNKMNDIIRPRIGANHQITSGSKDEMGYHLVIGNPINVISDANKRRIGKILKEEYDDAAYYSGGGRIA